MNTPFTRKNVWLRDKGICRYCGNPVSPEQMVLIHVIPMSQGGPNTWDNVVTGCVECSVRKCALIQVVDGLNECEKAQLKQKGYTSAAFFTEAGELTPQYTWYAKEKKKYINIDCGGSGAFMVDKATGEIYNIKGYGTPDKNKKLKADLGNIATVDPKVLHSKRWNYLNRR